MIVYLAGFKSIEKKYPDDPMDIYLLSSYWEHRSGKFGEYVRSDKHMLDSGAFTAMANPGKHGSIDWRKYAERYADFVKATDQKYFLELDIDPIVGLPEVEILRDILEQRSGKASIPVWHKSRGLDKWHQMIESYEYVAIGGLVLQEIQTNELKYIGPLLKMAEKQNCKVHGLGFTGTNNLRRLKFHSVDSGTWLVGAKYGNYCLMKSNGTMNQKYPGRNENKRVIDREGLELYNFQTWVMFQKWAMRNL